MNKIIVSCMDCRLNSKFENENEEGTVLVRNAGGNVNGVERTLRYMIENSGVRELHIATHTDCGAMKYVLGVLNGKSGENGLNSALVDQFRNSGAKDLADLEKTNEKVQRANAERLFSGNVNVTSELIDISKFATAKHDGEHVLVVTRSSGGNYEKIAKALGEEASNCYFIQAESAEEVVPDFAIAVKKIGIKDIRMVALKKEDYRPMLMDVERMKLTARNLGEGIKISFVKL